MTDETASIARDFQLLASVLDPATNFRGEWSELPQRSNSFLNKLSLLSPLSRDRVHGGNNNLFMLWVASMILAHLSKAASTTPVELEWLYKNG